MTKICTVDGCRNKHFINGLCRRHDGGWVHEVSRPSKRTDFICAECKVNPVRDSLIKPGKTGMRLCDYCHEHSQRNRLYKHKYGISLSDYERLCEEADGKCSACGLKPELLDLGGPENWHKARLRLNLDHDHKTGEVRGLLCFWCNITLGHAHEDADRLRGLASYIEKFTRCQKGNDFSNG